MGRERGLGDGLRRGALSATTLKVVAAIEPGLAERLATDLAASGYRVTPIRAGALPSNAALVLVRPASDRALEVLRRGPLELNLSTYQATMSGRRLDLTYMEYSLLRYLAASPGRVHARTDLLADVWGYGSFGGVRTVDVHVRRLRAKLGEEHARLIETVRRVGYRFSTEPAS